MDNEALIVELETNEARQRDYDDKVTQKLDSLDQVSSSSIFFTINDIALFPTGDYIIRLCNHI